MTPPVTIVGNGVAGFACARRLREHGIATVLIGPGLPCDRPPLTKRALTTARLPQLADAAGLRQLGIHWIDAVALSYAADSRSLRLQTREGAAVDHRCEGPLVWATGVAIGEIGVPGAELAACNATPAGFVQTTARLQRPETRRVTVIGGGLIGCETAATLAPRHRVTLIEREPALLARMPSTISAAVSRTLADVGVGLITGATVEGIEQTPAGQIIHTGASPIAADLVIRATGVARALPAGVGDHTALGLDTDARLQVLARADEWACGDVAAFPHPRFGRIAVPHWDNAIASGRHVADAIAGSEAAYCRDPYWFSDIGPLRLQVVGLERAVREWRAFDRMQLGLDEHRRVACAVLIDNPTHIRRARDLVASAAEIT